MTSYSHCYHCAQRLGVFSPRYKVMQAVKPKGAPYRWKQIGAMCESCEAAGCCTSYDPFSTAKRFKQQVEKRTTVRDPGGQMIILAILFPAALLIAAKLKLIVG